MTARPAGHAELVGLAARLIQLDSVNPALVADGAGETAIARFVAEWATHYGMSAQTVESVSGRPSVVVRSQGGRGRSLLLCAHLDTVGFGGMIDPLMPSVLGDQLHGRGAYDMKTSLAIALLACRYAPAGADVIVAAVADEEHASIGVQEVLESVSADAAIVLEPTEVQVVVAHKGFVWSSIEVVGRAAHGSRPEDGIDAIVAAGPVLSALGALDASLGTPVHPLLGRGSVHASLISGGVELSSYPASCTIGVERRTLPGETVGDVEAALDRVCAAGPASHRTTLVRDPFAIDPEAEIVRTLSDCASAADVSGVAFWADSAFIAAAGIPTVLYGPRGAGAHADVEWVSIASAERVLGVVNDVIGRFCVS